MIGRIQASGVLAGLRCISLSRPLPLLEVAGQPLGRLQAQRLVEAGFNLEVDEGAVRTSMTQRGDAWLSLNSLDRLRREDSPARIAEASGEVLAWTGSSEPAEDGVLIPADTEDLLLRYPWDLLRLHERLVGGIEANDIRGEVSTSAHLEGRIRIGKGTRILPGVFVEGNVVIGEHCKIGPNCYLRGNTAIGDHCHIGQAVEIKNSVIGTRTSIGHLSYCGDSIIGERVNLGAGTITSNLRHDGANHRSMVEGVLLDTGRRKFGAVIGDGVHTGIHTSIYPGRKLWPGTSTRPGEVVQKDLMPS